MTRRVCKLADKNNRKSVDLRDYEDIILDVINKIAPNKNPKVEEHSFSSDPLTQSHAVRLGLALSAIPDLAVLGKTITTFRLFDGRIVEDNKSVTNKATSQVTTKDKQSKAVKNKEERQHGRYHRKKIPNDRGSTNTISPGKQKKNQSIREAVP